MSVSRPTRPAVALAIAGFDPSSGAGITADLQVFAAHGLYGTAAITALTVQSTRGVAAVRPVDAGLLRATLAELQGDLPPAGIKIGMLGSAEGARAVAEFLIAFHAAGDHVASVPVVLDPVLRSSSGAGLLEEDGLEVLGSELLPLVDWVTPNWSELSMLSGMKVLHEADAKEAMDRLGGRFPKMGVIATGGDLAEPVDLLRLPNGVVEPLRGTHVKTNCTHGTGCAFSSALLCRLVNGAGPVEAAAGAKRYVEGALRSAPGLGGGRGPMDLLWRLRNGSRPEELL